MELMKDQKLLLMKQPLPASFFTHACNISVSRSFQHFLLWHSSSTWFSYFDSSQTLPLFLVDIYFLSLANLIPLPPKSHKECASKSTKQLNRHVGFENQNYRIFHQVICLQIVSGIPSPLWTTMENKQEWPVHWLQLSLEDICVYGALLNAGTERNERNEAE